MSIKAFNIFKGNSEVGAILNFYTNMGQWDNYVF